MFSKRWGDYKETCDDVASNTLGGAHRKWSPSITSQSLRQRRSLVSLEVCQVADSAQHKMFLRKIHFPLLCISLLVTAISVDGGPGVDTVLDPSEFRDANEAEYYEQAKEVQDAIKKFLNRFGVNFDGEKNSNATEETEKHSKLPDAILADMMENLDSLGKEQRQKGNTELDPELFNALKELDHYTRLPYKKGLFSYWVNTGSLAFHDILGFFRRLGKNLFGWEY